MIAQHSEGNIIFRRIAQHSGGYTTLRRVVFRGVMYVFRGVVYSEVLCIQRCYVFRGVITMCYAFRRGVFRKGTTFRDIMY